MKLYTRKIKYQYKLHNILYYENFPNIYIFFLQHNYMSIKLYVSKSKVNIVQLSLVRKKGKKKKFEFNYIITKLKPN